jgi:hypothetical protein
MDSTRVLELLVGLQKDHANHLGPGPRLCQASVELLGVDGAAILLMDEPGNGSSFGSSDETIGAVEDLQFTFGEGPGVDAHSLGRPVSEPHLERPVDGRWSAFAPAAVAAGLGAAFGFPLQIGAIRLGALDLYQHHAGELSGDQTRDAIHMAQVVADAAIGTQAGDGSGALSPGRLGRALHAEVHQASGMVSRQLDVSVEDALVRLRAYAYAEGRPIGDVARDVVDRRLRLG